MTSFSKGKNPTIVWALYRVPQICV